MWKKIQVHSGQMKQQRAVDQPRSILTEFPSSSRSSAVRVFQRLGGLKDQAHQSFCGSRTSGRRRLLPNMISHRTLPRANFPPHIKLTIMIHRRQWTEGSEENVLDGRDMLVPLLNHYS